jgi:hypothetical protein
MENAIDENWQVVTALFPQGWELKAKETGAITRQRG